MLSPRVWMNDVPSPAMLFAFCASPGALPPKSPIAAKLKVCPAGAVVRKLPAATRLAPSPTWYLTVAPAGRPVTVTLWCCTVAPSGTACSVAAATPHDATPGVGMLVHHEITADVAVTRDRYGPRLMVRAPVASVVPLWAVVAADTLRFESIALTAYECVLEAARPLSEYEVAFGRSTVA